MANGNSAPQSSKLGRSPETRETNIEHLNGRMKVWADQIRTELSLYQDGGRIWNRIKFDMFSNQQKRTLSPEIQELFEQQRYIEQAYHSLDAAEQYKERLRSIPNLSDEFVRKALLQRGYRKPPKRRQELAPSEKADSSQETVSSTKRTERERDIETKPLPKTPERKRSRRKAVPKELERQFEEAVSIINSQLAHSVDGPKAWNELVRAEFNVAPDQLARMTPLLQSGFKQLQQVRERYQTLGLRSAYRMSTRVSKATGAAATLPRKDITGMKRTDPQLPAPTAPRSLEGCPSWCP